MAKENKLLIITAPSGAGKTSITRHLMKQFPQLAFSISAATREPRAHEKNGLDYYFVSVEEFQHKIQQSEFVEWEMVYEGKYYGTLKNELQRIWDNEQTPVLDIDVKGAIHVQGLLPEHSLSVFIEPPSIEELKHRLQKRGTETEATMQDRLNKASYELSFKHSFNKVIINNDLAKACKEAEEIVAAFLNEEK